MPDNGAQFSVVAANVASNISYTATSSAAILTVLAETSAPVLINALVLSSNRIQLNFSEPITPATATNLANYALTNTAGTSFTITNATLGVALTNVVLTCTPLLVGGLNHTVIVSGLRDQFYAGNYIATNSTAGFFFIAANAPTLTSVTSTGNNGVQVVYSTNVLALSATNLANYALTNLSGTVIITGATIGGDGKTVQLITASQLPFAKHWLTINGVLDAGSGLVPVAPNTQGVFTNGGFTLGFIRRELYMGIGGNAVSDLTSSAIFLAQRP